MFRFAGLVLLGALASTKEGATSFHKLSVLICVELLYSFRAVVNNTTADIDIGLNGVLLNSPALKRLDFLKTADSVALVQRHSSLP